MPDKTELKTKPKNANDILGGGAPIETERQPEPETSKMETGNGEVGDDDEGDKGPSENLLEPTKKSSKADFNFLKVIGRGSFGKVYMVKKRGTN